MRSLIRPALFIVVRLGLFIAVVAWGVGQWSDVSILIPLPKGMAAVELSPRSWHYRRMSGRFAIGLNDIARTPLSPISTIVAHEKFLLQASLQFADKNERANRRHEAAEFHTAEFHPVETAVVDFTAIRHWLIVTIFAASYGVLKFAYQKRGTEVVGDE